ncbi:MAG TPA: protein-tyrosine phosphatase family protein [Hyphomicrobiaceae bacterium]|nr:protein-tyrosine phosphatase family protein [Hyphomicrobiaceae bacterium]
MHDTQSIQLTAPAQAGETAAATSLGVIHVCPISAVPELLVRTGARHLITVINEHMLLATPQGFSRDNHLRLAVHDIIEPQPGLICPGPEHVAQLISFARRWNHDGPLVIHCHAGISRSPAAAFIALCTLNPNAPELRLAERIRQASPTALPNRRMVELADAALGRGGRMVEAIERIGMAEPAIEAVPFAVESRHG